ncbi:MAG: adenylate/guanylate cyclase domain-containing protein [Chloroflexota bacterium]|nr:MAG: adenylate/guanylate cyclase domain-containing protein [Chloroflexota bacterium]
MTKQILPEHLQKHYGVETVEEAWQLNLTEGNTRLRARRHLNGMLPSNPRCVNCHRPFAGPGGFLMRLRWGDRMEKSAKNPRFCTGCYSFTSEFPGGAEIELTMLFVDVRGSTTIAENMNDTDFSNLMNRFYEAAINVLVREDAFIDKLVGDEVTALFIPGYAGKEHAKRAVMAGKKLLEVTGHIRGQPWVPVGVGIHTGMAWVGSIAGAKGEASDFTALGDNVNVAARLASVAAQGEVVMSDATYEAAKVDNDDLEIRKLELKGKSELIKVRVMKA